MYDELSLPNRYKMLREEKGLTIKELSQKIKCNEKTISFYENGDREISIGTLQKYADFFEVSTDYLLGYTDIRTAEVDTQIICNATGLSEKAVLNLVFMCKHIKMKHSNIEQDTEEFVPIAVLNAVNTLIESSEGTHILYAVYCYIHSKELGNSIYEKEKKPARSNTFSKFFDQAYDIFDRKDKVEREKRVSIDTIEECLEDLQIKYEESTMDYEEIQNEIETLEKDLKHKQKKLNDLKKQMEISKRKKESKNACSD